MSFLPLLSNVGLDKFDLSSADNALMVGEKVLHYDIGSLDVVWSGATSSDGFTSKGQFAVETSNNKVDWEPLVDSTLTPVVIRINAASGHVLVRRMLYMEWAYIRFNWTKNNSTGGSATCYGIFKHMGSYK